MTTCFETVEARWIGPGSGPDPAAVLPRGGEQPERRDHYAPSGPGCGLKVREDGLELKVLVAELGERIAAGGAQVAAWRKWRWEWPEAADEIPLLGTHAWRAVAKTRRLHSPAPGEQVECSRLRLDRDHEHWWTLCVEIDVGSDQAAAERRLATRVAEFVSRADLAPALEAAAGLSVPGWLAAATRQ